MVNDDAHPEQVPEPSCEQLLEENKALREQVAKLQASNRRTNGVLISGSHFLARAVVWVILGPKIDHRARQTWDGWKRFLENRDAGWPEKETRNLAAAFLASFGRLGVVALIGSGLPIWLLIQQNSIMRKQAGIMERHEVVMTEQSRAMKAQSKLLKNQGDLLKAQTREMKQQSLIGTLGTVSRFSEMLINDSPFNGKVPRANMSAVNSISELAKWNPWIVTSALNPLFSDKEITVAMGAALVLRSIREKGFHLSRMIEMGVKPKLNYDPPVLPITLSRVELGGAHLPFINLSNTTLFGAEFSGSQMSFSDFSGSRFYGASFHDTNLLGVDFSQSYLEKVDLEFADCTFVNFSGADLRWAKNFTKIKSFKHANVCNVKASDWQIDYAIANGAVEIEEEDWEQYQETADFSD